MKIHMSWRLVSRLSVITLAVLVVLVITVVQQQRAAQAALQGTDLNKSPAPNFALTDQYGKKVALENFRGKPVVLTFLYTTCPDVCPLTAEYLHQSMEQLGADAAKVGIVAVSTDPQKDDVAAALRFSQQHRMENYWHYLVGTKDELSPIWSNYSVAAQQLEKTVMHTSVIYFIDKEGRERTLIMDTFQPEQITHNLQALLQE
jgi:protein SCO1/2